MQKTPSHIPSWALTAALGKSYQWVLQQRARNAIPLMDVRRQGWRPETIRRWNPNVADKALRIMKIASEAAA